MCGWTDCVSIGYFHSDNNAFVTFFITDSKKKRDSYLPGSRFWTNANGKLAFFLDNHERNVRPKDVLNLVQCQPVDNAFLDLDHYGCAKGTCQLCPQMCSHPVLMRSNKLILFHAYKMVTTCIEHEVLSAESNGRCQHCDGKRDGELIGKFYKKDS